MFLTHQRLAHRDGEEPESINVGRKLRHEIDHGTKAVGLSRHESGQA